MLSDNQNMVMPVSPMCGNGGNGGFGDGFGGWFVILFLFALMGGWGNGFGGGFGGNEGVLPYMWNTATQNDVNRGFDTASISSQLSGIQTSISNGFATSEISDCNRAMDAMQTAYSNQIASMNQRFADSQALTSQLNGIAMNLQNCCCENRANIGDLKYTIATENCADRAAISDGVRNIIANNTANMQAILDKLCALELDGFKRENDNLRTQLNMATLNASQTAQTAQLIQSQNNVVDNLYTRLSNCPVPAVPVYGKTNIFSCSNGGCGCGM